MKLLDQLKEIVNSHSYKEIDGVTVDVQTANTILTVYEVLGEKNKKHFISQDIIKMSSIAWKLIK